MGEQELSSLPFVRGQDGDLGGFAGGRSVGYLSEIALQEPYRSEADEQARQLGYAVGALPFVPLKGRIVSENPVPLEVYGTVLAFSSPSNAVSFMTTLRSSGGGTAGVPLSAIEIGLSGDVYAYHSAIGPDLSTDEEVTAINFRDGAVVLQIAVRGGKGMSDEFGAALATQAFQDLQACGS